MLEINHVDSFEMLNSHEHANGAHFLFAKEESTAICLHKSFELLPRKSWKKVQKGEADPSLSSQE